MRIQLIPRQLSASVGLLALCLAVAASAEHSSRSLRTEQLAEKVKLTQIAKNVYVFSAGDTTHDVVNGTVTAIVTEDGVVVVDAPNPLLARRHLQEIRKLTNQPVRYVINTHWHGDHTIGNFVYKSAFPDVRVIAQAYTAEISDSRGYGVVEHFYKAKPGEETLAQLRRAAESGTDDEGKPLSPYELARAQRAYAEFSAELDAMNESRHVAPDLTYESEMTIRLGSKEIRLLHFQGHTIGDTVVHLPDDSIVITGDLVIHPVPYGINSRFRDWPKALERLIALEAGVIVPGHGEPLYSDAYLRLERDLLNALMTQAASAARERMALEDFKTSVRLEEFRATIAGDDEELNWAWRNYFFEPALETAYRMARGEY